MQGNTECAFFPERVTRVPKSESFVVNAEMYSRPTKKVTSPKHPLNYRRYIEGGAGSSLQWLYFGKAPALESTMLMTLT